MYLFQSKKLIDADLGNKNGNFKYIFDNEKYLIDL